MVFKLVLKMYLSLKSALYHEDIHPHHLDDSNRDSRHLSFYLSILILNSMIIKLKTMKLS